MMPSQSRGAGRPRGQFDYHKLRLLAFLQQNSPYDADWDALRAAVAEHELHVSTRQLARYVRQLELEETPDGKPRVEMAYLRLKGADGNLARRRVIICHDTRPLNF